jgi:hypothetical protein
MKKLIINALGIMSVITMLVMAVVKIAWSEKTTDKQSGQHEPINDAKDSEDALALMCDRIDHLSENVNDIGAQDIDMSSESDNSSRNNRRRFDESLFEDAYSYDPTDYPDVRPFENNVRNVNRIDDVKKAKPPDIIE